MTIIRNRYPVASANTVPITITLADLSDSTTLTNGRASAFVDNRTDLDTDHLISGQITSGVAPFQNSVIEVWAYSVTRIVGGVPSYPGDITGVDENRFWASQNQKLSALTRVWSTLVDNTGFRPYFMPPVGLAELFGEVPPIWGLWVTQNTGVTLSATPAHHWIHYTRVQRQAT